MKTKIEIRGALASHNATMSVISQVPEELVKLGLKMGWSPERVKGYLEGVQFAYKWVLGESV